MEAEEARQIRPVAFIVVLMDANGVTSSVVDIDDGGPEYRQAVSLEIQTVAALCWPDG